MALIVCLLLLSGLTFAGGEKETPAETKTTAAPAAKTGGYSEAPMLAELVRASKLPPVDQRLPKEPVVVKPVSEIGQYGGTYRRVATRATDNRLNDRMGYEPIIRRARDAKTIIPGIAKSWEILDGGKAFVFYLREGMKWSDGQPFSADDFVFYYEDVLLNKDLNPSFPSRLTVAGSAVKVEKLSDYVVKYSFVKPYGLFTEFMAFRGGWVYAPKHYLKQFHPKYAKKNELDAKVKAAEYEFWYQLYGNRAEIRLNKDCPTIRAWKLMTETNVTRQMAERNPFYWKVDPEGNQLPYIDRVTYDMVESAEIADIAYLGLAEPWACLPVEEDPYYVPPKPENTEHNVDKANRLLDEIGLSQRDRDGFRLGPDGKTVVLRIESYGSEEAGGAADALELVKEYWKKVGLKTTLKFEDRSLWSARRAAGEIMVAAYLYDAIHWAVSPVWFVPIGANNAWASFYAQWYESGGKTGEEPIPELKKLQDLYDQMKLTVDDRKRTEIGRELIRSHVENTWMIGLVIYPALAIVKNNFKNVLETASRPGVYCPPDTWTPSSGSSSSSGRPS